MMLFFRRGGDALRLETRFDSETADYVAVVHQPDGKQQIKRFKDPARLSDHLLNVQRQLEADCWKRAEWQS